MEQCESNLKYQIMQLKTTGNKGFFGSWERKKKVLKKKGKECMLTKNNFYI